MQAGTKVIIIKKHEGSDSRIRRVGDSAVVDSFPGQGYGIASEDETMLVFDKPKSAGPVATPNQYFVLESRVERIICRPGKQKKVIFRQVR